MPPTQRPPSVRPVLAIAVALVLPAAAGAQALDSTEATEVALPSPEAGASFDDLLEEDGDDTLLATNITFLEVADETLESAENATVEVAATEDSDVFPTNVTYNLTGGSADGDDYQGGDGTLEFTEAGQVRTIVLALQDDDVHEGDETVELHLSSDDLHVEWGIRNHTHTLLDDDPANQPPEAPDLSLATDQGVSHSGTLPGSDPDGDDLTWSVTAHPAYGTLEVDADTGAFTYTPGPGYAGPDAFEYRVFDGEASDLGTVEVLVEEGEDADDGSPDGDNGTDPSGTEGNETTSETAGDGTDGASSSTREAGAGGVDGAADLGADDDPSTWWLLAGTLAVVACGGAIAYGYYWSQHGRL